LEGLVTAHRSAARVAALVRERAPLPRPRAWSARGTRPPLESVAFELDWDMVRRVMWDLVGIVRTDQRLRVAERRLQLMRAEVGGASARLRLDADLIELRNIALVGPLIVRCAMSRHESRGLHYNLDHPRSLARYRGRDTVLRRRSGELP